jgi:hypothetical protein
MATNKPVKKGLKRWIELWQLDHDRWEYEHVRAAKSVDASWYVPLNMAWPQDEFSTLASIWEMFSTKPPLAGIRRLQHGDLVVLCCKYRDGVVTAAYLFADRKDAKGLRCLTPDSDPVQLLSDATCAGVLRGRFSAFMQRT